MVKVLGERDTGLNRTFPPHTHTHTHIHARTHTHTHARTHARTHTHTHPCFHPRTRRFREHVARRNPDTSLTLHLVAVTRVGRNDRCGPPRVCVWVCLCVPVCRRW